ncbi:MAG: DUF4143 domain-containing protein [Synergistaceae bacterium]|nr:DUF4143 domain-containing protein [Synergistaceae bacterium]
MKDYMPRIADFILRDRLESKGAVLVEGAKWCGKTTTSVQQAKSVLYMQDTNNLQQLEMADLKPSKLLEGTVPRLIDEWQTAPRLWDAVRFEVDKRDEFGQFILTGSAVPPDVSQILHSGTGRISHMLMRPMSLFESGDSNGAVSLSELFSGAEDIDGACKTDIDLLAFLICRGGWPKAIGCSERVALRHAFDYCDAVVNSDISRADNVRRSPENAKRLLRAYGRAVASQTKIPSIAEDMFGSGRNSVSNNTVASYVDALEKIFVIENAPAWNPNLRSKTAIRSSETRYFTDPSIGTAALGLGVGDLIGDLNTMGLFFENLCIRDLRVYADALDGSVYHYRDRNGLECDAVVHLRNGSYGLIEIKLGGSKLIEEGAAVLNKLEQNIDTSKMKAPSFKMLLTGIGDYAYRRKDGIFVVPVCCLKN